MGVLDYLLIGLIVAGAVAALVFSLRHKGGCQSCRGCSSCGDCQSCRSHDKSIPGGQ